MPTLGFIVLLEIMDKFHDSLVNQVTVREIKNNCPILNLPINTCIRPDITIAAKV